MGLIDKIRSSLPIPGRGFRHPQPAEQFVAVVLLDRPLSSAQIRTLLDAVPGQTASAALAASAESAAPDGSDGPDGPDRPILVTLAHTSGFVLPVDARLPDGEVEDSAANNPFWAAAGEAVARHRAHLVVSVTVGESGPSTAAGSGTAQDTADGRHTQAYAAFARLVAALVGHGSAVGVYLADQGVVYEPAFYVEAVTDAGDGFPWEVAWFTWAAWEVEGQSCGSTRGLRVFGHEELEVRGSTAQPSSVMDLLANVASYIVENGASLMPGESLGYTDDQRLAITAVEGSFSDGNALRISLP